MGMVGHLREVTETELPHLLTDADYGPELLDGEEIAEGISLGKWWHAVHFGLTGRSDLDDLSPCGPLGDAVMGLGGRKIAGSEDEWGYGVPMVISAAQAREVHRALADFKIETYRERLLGGAGGLPGVYKFDQSTREDRQEALPELEELLDAVCEFYEDAVENGSGVAAYLV
jgi:hypothetical protein